MLIIDRLSHFTVVAGVADVMADSSGGGGMGG